MEMSNREIVHRYVDLDTPINILAELNAVKNDEIKKILQAEGVDLTQKKKIKNHVVQSAPSKPYQGEFKERKPYTKSGLYTKEAKAARAVERIKKQIEAAENITEEEITKMVKPTKEKKEPAKPNKEEVIKAAEPEMSETVRKIIFNRLDELDVKMSYHQEQLREYEREYKELTKTLGIKRAPNEF